MGFNLENLKDVIQLSKAGWTLQDIKEVCEMLSTQPEVKSESNPEELKAAADKKSVEELPATPEEDPIDTLKSLVK